MVPHLIDLFMIFKYICKVILFSGCVINRLLTMYTDGSCCINSVIETAMSDIKKSVDNNDRNTINGSTTAIL